MKSRPLAPRRAAARGSALLEMTLAIGILGLGLLIAINTVTQGDHDADDEANTQILQMYRNAAMLYVRKNYTQLAADTTSSPAIISADDLAQASPMRNSIMQSVQQHNYVLALRQPQPGVFDGVLIGSGNGNSINRDRLPSIAARMGPFAGFVNDSGTSAQGGYASWTMDLAPFLAAGLMTGPGRLAIYMRFTEQTLNNEHLHRNPTTVPGGNRMFTPLQMTQYNMGQVDQTNMSEFVDSDPTTAVENTPCSVPYALAGWTSNSKTALLCTAVDGGLTWKQYIAVPRAACPAGQFVSSQGRNIVCRAP